MKFYKRHSADFKLVENIILAKENAVVCCDTHIVFFNKGLVSNVKNAAYILFTDNYKEYRIDAYLVGTNFTFNKEKFRRYVNTMCFI